jgi:trypsin
MAPAVRLLQLAACLAGLRPVLCAGGRLTIGGPAGVALTGRVGGGGHQEIGPFMPASKQSIGDGASHQRQDLVQVLELDTGALAWTGAKSASELAPESQVVGVHFGLAHSPTAAGQMQADERPRPQMAPAAAESSNNKTKQSQEFDTHQQQQQQRPSTTGQPQADTTKASTSAPTTQQTTTATAATTTSTPPGWPVRPEQTSTTSAPGQTTSEPPTPVGTRIDREGEAVLCGEANANGKSNKRLISDRIVGGHKTEPGEFPFQVRLNIRSRRGSGICGGVVLDRWHVLTAAHCMTACVSHQLTTATIESSGVKVTVGDHSIKSDDGELELEAETITPHEKYDACNFYANDHDIALIKTAQQIPFKFTTDGYGSINRPCMPPSSQVQYKDGEMVIVSGWGVTRENSGALSNILRYVQVPVVNVTRCQETYGSRVTHDHVCAGFQAGGKDSCQGDSGGPLVRVVDNRYELVGIVSFGYGCGQAGAAGVYTRVASYLDWIEANKSKPPPPPA